MNLKTAGVLSLLLLAPWLIALHGYGDTAGVAAMTNAPSNQPSPALDYDKVLEEQLAIFNDHMKSESKAYFDNYAKFEVLWLAPETITSKEEVQQRMDSVTDVISQGEALLRFVRNSDVEYVLYLKDLHAENSMIIKSVDAFRTKSKMDKLGAYYDSQGKILLDYYCLYDFLQKNYGQWKVVDKKILFHGSSDDDGNTKEAARMWKDIFDDFSNCQTLSASLNEKP